MIRATSSGMYTLVRTQTAAQSAALQKAQAQAMTGQRVTRPSDDPTASASAERLSAAVADQDVWMANAEAAVGVHDIADSALASVNDVLVRAREIAVAMSSETTDTAGRAAMALEVQGLQDALLEAANTQYDGRYVFAGANWSTAPFADDGTYAGDTTAPQARVGEERWVDVGFDGSAIFSSPSDIFGTLSDLEAALTSDSPSGVQATLTDIDAGIDQISAARGDIGAQTGTAEDALTVAETMKAVLGENLTRVTEVDAAEAYSRLTELVASYQATLQVAGSAATGSLLDYLK